MAMPVASLDADDRKTTGDPVKDAALGVFFSEFADADANRTRLSALIGAVGGVGAVRLAGGVARLTELSGIAIKNIIKYTYLPFTFWGKDYIIAKAALDGITFIPFLVLETQIMNWILGGPQNMPPIEGFRIERGPDGEVVLVMPELWLVDP